MKTHLDHIRDKIAALHAELEKELYEKREQFRYTVEKGKIRFQNAAKSYHRTLRQGILSYLKTAPVMFVLTSPFIYMVLVPFVLLDVLISIYQKICFPVYGLPQVKRSDYLKLDRHKLHYLNIIQKINCEYCSYGNGILAYASEIASLTEMYWCPIKHASTPAAYHGRYPEFIDYGDAENYTEKLSQRRKKACEDCNVCKVDKTS